MFISRNVGISLHPYFNFIHVPFAAILNGWIGARLAAPRCRSLLEDIVRRANVPEGLFRPEAIDTGDLVAGESLLFPSADRWVLTISSFSKGKADWARRFTIPREGVGEVSHLLRLATQAEEPEVLRELLSELDDDEELFHRLRASPSEARAPWGKACRPGLYRREHASLVVRSETTALLVDPIALVGDRLSRLSEAPVTSEDIDGVLITHMHEDHWHLPSVLHHTLKDGIPVVVPHVARANLLCPEVPADTLGQVGLNALAPSWGSRLVIGDIEIDVLPFYGEQPTRDAPGPPAGIRSWGNCYRFQTPQFSALLLVDAGADPAGDMREVMRESRTSRGPVDVVVSCMRSFASPFFAGLPTYFMTLPFSRLANLFAAKERGGLPPTTAGPEGLVELCAEVGARHFLPYAHGFAGHGQPIMDIGWGEGEPSEQEQLRKFSALIASRRCGAQAHAWNPGDMASFMDGQLRIHSYEELGTDAW